MISACSAKSSPGEIGLQSEDSAFEGSDESSGISPSENASENPSDSRKPSPLEPTKVIVRFYIDMQTIEFDQSISTLNNLISKYEGYVESSNIHLGDYYSQSNYRSADYTIRIPKTKADTFIEETGTIGKINNLEESKEDVTMHYRDTESRLEVLNIKEERVLALLKKAEKMEDIIALENSLSDVIYEKENLGGVLKNLDNKVDFTTITIYLREVEKIDLKDSGKLSFGERISNAMSNSLHSFKIGFENFIIQLIYAFPAMVLFALLAYGIYKGVHFYNKKKPKRPKSKDEEK